MAGVAILVQVMLLAPEFPGAEAQPHASRRNVGFQRRQPQPKIGEAPTLLVDLIPSTTLGGVCDAPPGTRELPPQAVQPQLLLLFDRRYLPFQRHPHTVEHPRRYPVPLQVRALQRYRRPTRRHLAKQPPLHATVKPTVGRERCIASLTISARVLADPRMISCGQPLPSDDRLFLLPSTMATGYQSAGSDIPSRCRL